MIRNQQRVSEDVFKTGFYVICFNEEAAAADTPLHLNSTSGRILHMRMREVYEIPLVSF